MSTTRLRLAFLVLSLATLSACAAQLDNTPAQNLAYERWAACRGLSDTAVLERVEPDGRIWFRYYQIDTRDHIVSCLRARSQSGPALPAPVGDLYPRS